MVNIIINYDKNKYNDKNIFISDTLKKYFIEIFLNNRFKILNKNESLLKNDVILLDMLRDFNPFFCKNIKSPD